MGCVSPILINGQLRRSGLVNEKVIARLLTSCGLRSIQMCSVQNHGTILTANQLPLIKGRTNQRQTPSDMWFNIARTNNPNKFPPQPSLRENVTQEEIKYYFDELPECSASARRISVSLKNADIALNSLHSAHSEALQRLLPSGQTKQVSLDMDAAFSAHSQALLIALGAARDHFASLIAHRLGYPKKVDDLTRLLGKVGKEEFIDDSLFQLLISENLLSKDASGTYKIGGWLESLGQLRKQYVHHVPYGLIYEERFGNLRCLNEECGIWGYTRPIKVDGQLHSDMLDFLGGLYSNASDFFFKAAAVSGYDSSIPSITSGQVISFQMK